MKDFVLKNKLLLGIIALALVFGVAGYSIVSSFAQPKEAKNNETKEEKPSQSFVNALGRIEPQGEVIKLTAPSGQSGAIVTKISVEEGEEIDEGQVVALLDGIDQQLASVREAESRVEIARQKLAQVRAGAKDGDLSAQDNQISRLETELATAKSDLRRAESPNGSGITPLPEFVAIKRLETEINNAKTELSRAENRTPSPIGSYANLEKLEAELRNAETELKRAEILSKTGDVSRSELDSRRLKVETLQKDIKQLRADVQTSINDKRLQVKTLEEDLRRSKATLQSVVKDKRLLVQTLEKDILKAKSTYSGLAEVRPTDVSAAEAEIKNAQALLERARADLDAKSVKSYTKGKVLKINTRAGESIGNDGILEIGDTGTMFVVAEVFEADISRVKSGQKAEITVRTSGEKFEGEVVQVGSLIKKRDVLDSDPVADVDARVVEVKIKLGGNDSKLLARLTNLRVDCRITTAY
jgi:HlyD family secretion protein